MRHVHCHLNPVGLESCGKHCPYSMHATMECHKTTSATEIDFALRAAKIGLDVPALHCLRLLVGTLHADSLFGPKTILAGVPEQCFLQRHALR